ncbi:MAG TPA: type II toxin-antitoxin system PemK/MazF family toxin [Geminicoccaceae bacterium]|nr:type II toxin-antitoxin system PemK/MazF family toxin [Geminicoccaceae bacterium]
MDVVTAPRQFEIWLVGLDPTVGAEIRKTRPAIIVSPDTMNRNLLTSIIVPLTTTLRRYPNRVGLTFQGTEGQAALDQIRAVDRKRLVRKLGECEPATARVVSETLCRMFTYRDA